MNSKQPMIVGLMEILKGEPITDPDELAEILMVDRVVRSMPSEESVALLDATDEEFFAACNRARQALIEKDLAAPTD